MHYNDIESFRKQLYMLERTVRALRANFEQRLASLEEEPSLIRESISAMTCPLSHFLHSCHVLERKKYSPYENFAEGVCAAYPTKGNAVAVDLETRGFSHRHENETSGSTCLLLHVQRQSTATPAWATLEVEVDPALLFRHEALETRIILSFINKNWTSLGTFRVSLGLFSDAGFQDLEARTFPALDVPIEMAWTLSPTQMALLPKTDLQKAKIIIGLPTPENASYTAVLSHFEILGRNADKS
jgi:hypothetical protein